MESRSLRELGCLVQATLIGFCFSDDDLRGFGIWDDAPSRRGFAPAVWCRAFLHKACQREEHIARLVTDHLDLRHLEVVLSVRAATYEELECRKASWLQQPDGSALPGLLWALCSDARPAVHGLGEALCHEASVLASRLFVAPESPSAMNEEALS